MSDNNSLTLVEAAQFHECEQVIERGMRTFVDVGNALMDIRNGKLYRSTHGTFEDYCQERWSLSQSRSYELMSAAKVVMNIESSVITELLPTNVEQTKALASLSPEAQRAVWQQAVDTAPNGKITGAHVEREIGRYLMRPYKNSSESNEWYTPHSIIEKATNVMGAIDLDPASTIQANKTVQAARIYTIEDDAFMQTWEGRVWLNPPYGGDVDPFINKLLKSVESGTVIEAILLVAARTDTVWFRRLRTYSRCFIWGRLKFVSGETGESADPAGFPSMAVYMGTHQDKFVQEFQTIGDIYCWIGE